MIGTLLVYVQSIQIFLLFLRQEPGFAPADAPKELDRFVLALVALEANKHEACMAHVSRTIC